MAKGRKDDFLELELEPEIAERIREFYEQCEGIRANAQAMRKENSLIMRWFRQARQFTVKMQQLSD